MWLVRRVGSVSSCLPLYFCIYLWLPSSWVVLRAGLLRRALHNLQMFIYLFPLQCCNSVYTANSFLRIVAKDGAECCCLLENQQLWRIHWGKYLMWHAVKDVCLLQHPLTIFTCPSQPCRVHIVGSYNGCIVPRSSHLCTHSFAYHPTLSLLQICLAYRLCDSVDYLPAPRARFEPASFLPFLPGHLAKQTTSVYGRTTSVKSKPKHSDQGTSIQTGGETDKQTDRQAVRQSETDWADTVKWLHSVNATFGTVYFGLFFCASVFSFLGFFFVFPSLNDPKTGAVELQARSPTV